MSVLVKKPVIGVIGLGSVGCAVLHGMSEHYPCVGYDIIGDYDRDAILKTKIVFVCVSTPLGEDGHIDCSNIDIVLEGLNTDSYNGVVVIKSTIGVGYISKASTMLHGLRLVYMPEFLRERSSFNWFLKPDRLVLSGDEPNIREVLSYFEWVNGAEILRLSHRGAEIGKLAHNAYIATKVSFTNEIEMFCDMWECDPQEVMSVIWADRRVKSKEHLRPRMGTFGGKCVPKDTHELVSSFPDSLLLKAVEAVKDAFPHSPQQVSMPNVVVIIPTKNRPVKLRRALESVSQQTVKPNAVLVVGDCNETNQAATEHVVSSFIDTLQIEMIRNFKASNLSGAINSGISVIADRNFNQENTFVALLDDDDWWDIKYIDNNIRFAVETDSDWVISGLIWHDYIDTIGVCQLIPDNVSIDALLVPNPNILGSNMFVRLSKFLETGGFDEALVSTTDIDFCIRLLELKDISYSILRNHLVHHDATDDPTRLSHPGSEKKKEGCNISIRNMPI